MSGFEILIYMSDQHGAGVNDFMGDPVARTPNLDRLAGEGAVFRQAYTACPLCVPARAALVTSRYPSELGVFGNNDAFSSQNSSFLHGLGRAGYETVLCGRMHFVGEEQAHGFEKRVARDFSPSLWGNPSEKRPQMGDFGRSLYQKWCLEIIGEGDSPVRAYDRYVTQRGIEYLESTPERPQALVIGTYGPHFPYVGDPERMAYYRPRIRNAYSEEKVNYLMEAAEAKRQRIGQEELVELRCAYYAMVEEMDQQLGQVYDSWRAYLERKGTKGIFVYLSDHGDQIGIKSFFGKQTFLEYSAKIPMIIQIDGQSPRDVEIPSSILDLGPTLCGLTGAQAPPLAEGRDWSSWLLKGQPAEDRPVYSEFFDRLPDGRETIGIMVRQGTWKYISYTGFEEQDLLFDLRQDPWELRDLPQDHPQRKALAPLAREAQKSRMPAMRRWSEQRRDAAYLAEWGAGYRDRDPVLWEPPVQVRRAPLGSKPPCARQRTHHHP